MRKVLFSLLLSLLAMSSTFAQNCVAPERVVALPRDTSAIVYWAAVSTSANYTLEVRLATDTLPTAWRVVNNATIGMTLNGLRACTYYVVRVKNNCSATASSGYGEPFRFKTTGCALPCVAPRELNAAWTPNNVFAVVWAPTNTLATVYEMQYRAAGDTTWTSVSATRPGAVTGTVRACTNYHFRVRTRCTATTNSDWSSVTTVVSGGCFRCVAPRNVTSTVTGTTAVLLWDSLPGTATYRVQVRRQTDTTWTTQVVTGRTLTLRNLTACTSYVFRVQSVCSATASSDWGEGNRFITQGCPVICTLPRGLVARPLDSVAILAWVGTAANYSVQVRVVGDSTWRTLSATGNQLQVAGLRGCARYEFRVKAVCSTTSSSDWTPATRFETACPRCIAPVVTATLVGDSMVVVRWAGLATNQGYLVQYRLAADTAWISRTTTASVAEFRLRTCQTYVFRVQSVCANQQLSEAANVRITTNCVSNCTPVAGLAVSSTPNGTVASWTLGGIVLPPSVRFEVTLRRNDSIVRVDTVTTYRFVFTNLVACQQYVVRVRLLDCSPTSTVAFASTSFRSYGVNCLTNGGNGSNNRFAASPNPSQGQLQLNYEVSETGNIQIEMVNLQGQIVETFNEGVREAGNYQLNKNSVENLTAGMYLLNLRQNGRVVQTTKWVKE
ncbi:MAG: hypothetical protein RL757_2850 [Bacteroidota bacterium]|jgi:hypothetical protein